MKPRRFNKYERKENRENKLRTSMAGTGLFIYENNTGGDLSLPKPTASGLKRVGPRQQFQGDSYFQKWVGPPMNMLRLIGTVSPAANTTEGLQMLKEGTDMSQKKLILDQPDTINHKGKVEHVIDEVPQQKIHESNPNQKQSDALLTEEPLDGVEIILS